MYGFPGDRRFVEFWDVTKAVKNWYNGATNYGFVLKAQDEAAVARNIYFENSGCKQEKRGLYLQLIRK